MTIDQVVEGYIKTRNDIKALEDQISELKSFQAKKEEWLLVQMAYQGAESVRGKHGTVYTTLSESVTVADAEEFFNWVKENEAWYFIEKRAAKSEVLNYMGERSDSGRPDSPPPGLNYVAVKKIGVRKG